MEKHIAYAFKAFVSNCFEPKEGRCRKPSHINDKEMKQLVDYFQGWSLLEKAAKVFYYKLEDVQHFMRIPIRNYDVIIEYTNTLELDQYPVKAVVGIDHEHPSTLSLFYPTAGWVSTFDMRKMLRDARRSVRPTRS